MIIQGGYPKWEAIMLRLGLRKTVCWYKITQRSQILFHHYLISIQPSQSQCNTEELLQVFCQVHDRRAKFSQPVQDLVILYVWISQLALQQLKVICFIFVLRQDFCPRSIKMNNLSWGRAGKVILEGKYIWNTGSWHTQLLDHRSWSLCFPGNRVRSSLAVLGLKVIAVSGLEALSLDYYVTTWHCSAICFI